MQKISMEAIAYIRGRSIMNQYVIVDEAQNLTPHEVRLASVCFDTFCRLKRLSVGAVKEQRWF
jgi:hypothetical protein